ncbi:MAG: GNAT family N-acetyltransferase [Methylophilus sp.]|nr:GNAT family N-acetyltransferase [Methylophilus sp.]
MKQSFTIEILTWNHPKQSLLKAVREQVFIMEKHVPLDIEWDEHDADAIHLLALDQAQRAIGCARILESGRVGRMAVLKAWRGYGLGQALLTEAIQICRDRQMKKIMISSQTHAIPFYQKAGFVVTSEAYIDVNIWHVDMQLNI